MQGKLRSLAEEQLPPYVSYQQWRRLLDDLATFLPSRFDTSYFEDRGISVTPRSTLKGALRFLGLMFPDGSPTERLKRLVQSDAEIRPKLLAATVREAYAPLFARLDVAHASRGQVEEYLKSEGIEGDIARRCWSFFRHIAADAKLELSPLLDKSKPGKMVEKVEKPGVQDIPRHRSGRPPYVSYQQWRRLLDDLATFLPSRFDTSYFEHQGVSVTLRSMLKGALRFMGLMFPDGSHTERLKRLVQSDAEIRPKVLATIVREAYAPLFAHVDVGHASRGQVEEYFKSEGIEGDIARKCWSFFRHIAADAKIEISPLLDKSNRGKKAEKTAVQDPSWHKPVRALQDGDDMTWWRKALLDKFPNFDPEWPTELKMKWLDDWKELLSRLGMAFGKPSSKVDPRRKGT